MDALGFVPYDLPAWQWCALFFCAVCIGMAKTGINGIITVAIPVFAFTFGAKESTGIILPMLCFADLMAVVYYRRSAEWKYILRLLPWALTGFVVALLVDRIVPERHFKILIGICILGGLAVMLLNDWRAKQKARAEAKEAATAETIPAEQQTAAQEPADGKPATSRAKIIRFITQFGFGIAGGFSTMIGNAAGPVMSVFLLSMRLPKASFIGTAAWFFMIINYIKIPVQALAWNNISLSGLKLGLILSPVIVLGAVLGIILVKLISEKHYRSLVYIMTLFSTVLLFV